LRIILIYSLLLNQNRLCGYHPFQARDSLAFFEEVTNARVKFENRFWRNVSEDG